MVVSQSGLARGAGDGVNHAIQLSCCRVRGESFPKGNLDAGNGCLTNEYLHVVFVPSFAHIVFYSISSQTLDIGD